MKEALINLLKVKTIVTLSTMAVFIYLSVKEILPVETTSMVIGSVIAYYFNKDTKEK